MPRHDGNVHLAESTVRRLIPTDRGPLDEATIQDIYSQIPVLWRATCDEIMDLYQWPVDWSHERRLIMISAANSEFQLIKYLSFLNGQIPAPSYLFDRTCNAVAGISATVNKSDE